MNVARGLLRIWVLFSVVWVLGIAAIAYGPLKQPYVPSVIVYYSSPDQAWRIAERYSYHPDSGHLVGLKSRAELADGSDIYAPVTWTKEEFSSRLRDAVAAYQQYGTEKRRQVRLEHVGAFAIAAIAVPMAVFIFGYGVLWAARGFKR